MKFFGQREHGFIVAREHAIAHDALRVIDVIDEQVQRQRALLQARLDAPPLIERNHTRNDIERPGAVDRATFLVIHSERDTHAADRDIGGLLARRELGGSGAMSSS